MAGLVISHTESDGGGDFKPTPEGTHIAVCSAVVDLGSHYSQTYTKWNHQVAIQWQLPEETLVVDGETVPRTVTKTFGLSLHEKASLRKTLESWRSKKLTPAELSSYNLEVLLGKGCQVTIVHNASQDGSKTYANVAGVVSLPKGVATPKVHKGTTMFSLSEIDNAVFEALPEWMQEKIQSSKEWKALDKVTGDPATDDEPSGVSADTEEEIGF